MLGVKPRAFPPSPSIEPDPEIPSGRERNLRRPQSNGQSSYARVIPAPGPGFFASLQVAPFGGFVFFSLVATCPGIQIALPTE